MSADTVQVIVNKESKQPSFRNVCQIFEAQAGKTPDNIALDFKEITLSYQLLNEKANQLARYIRSRFLQWTQQELKPDTLIALCIERSIDYVVGILAILKAGGAYVPINPDYPASRIQHILDDIQSVLVLTSKEHFNRTFEGIVNRPQPIFIDESPYAQESATNLNLPVHASHLAYVIYTSGSSGKPKGILAEQRNIVAQVLSADYFSADSADVMTFFSDVSFDSTIFEIWGALLNGARLFIPADLFNLLSNPLLFKQTLLEKKISIVLLTRSLFDMLYKLDDTVFASLRYLLVGAEALTKNLMLQLLQSPHKPEIVLNAYGPSENATFCITNRLQANFSQLLSVPIGKPYSNRLGLVLDKYKQLMPIGVVGELYVGGPGLSRGYLNQPELTQKSYISNPFHEEYGNAYSTIYKTHDLVRWLPEGNLEYIGRNDFQVKLRGYRIELVEIENSLLTFEDIQHAVVILTNTQQGFPFLVGYYVAKAALEEAQIRKHLAKLLPDYMIPTVFMHLVTLPVTNNGKLDRRALPIPAFRPLSKDNDLFENDSIEQKIYQIWTTVLNIRHFSKDHTFFELGGNSLVAMAIRKELEDTFGIQLNIVELFEHSTLTALSKRIAELTQPKKQSKRSDNLQLSSSCSQNEPIAVVGMACRLPGVANLEAFWELLLNEETNLVDFSDEVLNAKQVDSTLYRLPDYVKRGAVFEDSFAFDADFFGYSVRDAELMDPQQRQFLECAFEAMEHAGNISDKFQGDVGVFSSQGRNYYFMNNVHPDNFESGSQFFQALLGNEKDFLSTRTAFKLNLRGPSITIQTACSSSLVSIQMACESLKTRGCDMALAGGVSLFYNHGYLYEPDLIESPDGYCRAFDSDAKGTVVTSGVGVVVLKRLSDAISQEDTIYALIKGGAINNDGASKMAFTAPSVQGQMAVIEKALKNANVHPETISYIEAHGTGTRLGDPIEWSALHNVYQKYVNKNDFCTIGSVKTNIGHTDSAAGVFGLIKTVLALKHQILPATLNFKKINPEIASFNTLFRISNHSTEWENSFLVRRAAVSSFGLGGTNAHLILEEYQMAAKPENAGYHLIPFSAKNRESLDNMAQKLEKFLHNNPGTSACDIAFTAQQGRAEFKERGYFLINQTEKNERFLIKKYLRTSEWKEKHDIVVKLSAVTTESSAQYIDFLKALNGNQEAFRIEIAGKPDFDAANPYSKYVSFSGEKPGKEIFLDLIGWLWSQGVTIPWDRLKTKSARKVAIPGYSFIHRHFEIRKETASRSSKEAIPPYPFSTVELRLKDIWSQTLGIKACELTESSHFLELGGDSLTLIELLKKIDRSFNLKLKPDLFIGKSKFKDILHFIESRIELHECI